MGVALKILSKQIRTKHFGGAGIESIRANIESLATQALHMFGFEAFIDVLYLAAQTLAVQTRFVWLAQTLAIQEEAQTVGLIIQEWDCVENSAIV